MGTIRKKEAINFYRNLYSSALKTNSNLKMGVLTGIVQVAKEGIFSGLNNVITYNILGNDFETFFMKVSIKTLFIDSMEKIRYNILKIKFERRLL